MHLSTHVCEGQEATSSFAPQALSAYLFILRQGLSLAWLLPSKLGWLLSLRDLPVFAYTVLR